MYDLYLKPDRDRSVRRFHPWIFSGAVQRLTGNPPPGAIVDVRASEGSLIGRGFYNPHSQISCRMLAWQDEPIDRAFFQKKIHTAWLLRQELLHRATAPSSPDFTNAYRVVNAEGDGLPGLIVDRYADFLVIQMSTLGMVRWRQDVVASLQSTFQPAGIFERSTAAALREEALEPALGALAGNEPPQALEISESGMRFEVNLYEGQKTGFFLDQRENRKWISELAGGRKILNGFAYSGAFSVYAAQAGAAHVVTVDSSAAAISWAKRNLALNHLSAVAEDFVVADMFQFLRATTQRFDFIILDPPAFAHRQKEVENAARAYKDVNLQAMKIIAPGGLLFTCSCSQPISPDLFQKIIFAAAADAKRFVRILGYRGHAPDHPVSLYHPEGRYLQAWLLQVE
ncbi:MAG: class I SAM-dependent rRNA methyltransferase [bacterium]